MLSHVANVDHVLQLVLTHPHLTSSSCPRILLLPSFIPPPPLVHLGPHAISLVEEIVITLNRSLGAWRRSRRSLHGRVCTVVAAETQETQESGKTHDCYCLLGYQNTES